jgi:hypothetical protein
MVNSLIYGSWFFRVSQWLCHIYYVRWRVSNSWGSKQHTCRLANKRWRQTNKTRYTRIQESNIKPKSLGLTEMKQIHNDILLRNAAVQESITISPAPVSLSKHLTYNNTHRIHGAGIYANMTGVYWWDPWHTIYSSTIDPMGCHGTVRKPGNPAMFEGSVVTPQNIV